MEIVSKCIGLTHLPEFVRVLFRGMPEVFRHRHQLAFCWLVLIQMIFAGPRTLKGISAVAPSHIAEWHFRRLLSAGYWSLQVLLLWFSEAAIKSFPSPADKVIYIVADGSKKDKRGKKNPVVQKGRINKHEAFFFGIKFVMLMVQWDVYRIPVAFRILLRKNDPEYKRENQLFREMLKDFKPPEWAKFIIVAADSAYGSIENMRLIKELDKSDGNRVWGFVFAIARTWKMENDKSISNFVKHTTYKSFQKTWIPRLANDRGRKTFWVFRKRARLRHIGDVTIVLSKKGRNVGPKNTKILVTNLVDLTARQVISVYQRRWSIEILFKELKSGLGLGEHQVSKKIDRVEKSIGIAVIAYLVLIRARKEDISPGRPWSIFQLKSHFTNHLIYNQLRHDMEGKFNRLLKAA